MDLSVEVPMVDLLADMRREFRDVERPGPEHLAAFNETLHRELRDAVRLYVDEAPVPWLSDEAAVSGEPRLENQFAVYTLHLAAPLPAGSQTLNIINGIFPDEPSIFSTTVLVDGALIVDGYSLLDVEGGEVVASRDSQWRTEEENREIRLSFRQRTGLDAAVSRGLQTLSGQPAGALVSAREAHSGVDEHEEPLQALVRGELTPTAVAWGFLLAVILGAVHAMSPGHGKTLVAAYLLGERQTLRHAVWLGIIVTITHTLGVYILGGLALLFEDSFPPEILLPWMTLASGLLVLAVGAALFRARLRSPAIDHDHHHDHGHDHGHDHSHALSDEAHGAAHAQQYVEQGSSWWGIVSLGVSGGLAPCPSALVLLLTAVSFHRTLLGLALIVAFSAGLAALVTAVGVAAVVAGDRIRRRGSARAPWLEGAVRWLPVASAAVILVIGIGITLRGVGEILAVGG